VLPESIQGTTACRLFPTGSITSEAEMADVVQGALDKGKIEAGIPYQDLVDPLLCRATEDRSSIV